MKTVPCVREYEKTERSAKGRGSPPTGQPVCEEPSHKTQAGSRSYFCGSDQRVWISQDQRKRGLKRHPSDARVPE
jgi:hypothetical protein